uniref:Uncharacterized protein n=1 Tax=Arundo donax TaxID=35708 RepID=A0A0A9FJV1_ARUDO
MTSPSLASRSKQATAPGRRKGLVVDGW